LESEIKISIISPSYNQAEYIEETINSVATQKCIFPFEHIIQDGGSTDATLKVLKKNDDKIKWVSQIDDGQSHALSMALKRCDGNIIGWLNSDDLYLPGTLERVGQYFADHPECKWLYGRCKIINAKGKEIRKPIKWYKNIISFFYSYKLLLVQNYISQPAVFFRKDVFLDFLPDKTLHFAMDYDMWLRLGAVYKAGVIRKTLAAFRRHPLSKSETEYIQQFREQYGISKKYNNNNFIRVLHLFSIKTIIKTYYLIDFIATKFKALFTNQKSTK